MAPDISVIIPVRNGAGSLPALLDSLARQTLSAERFELIVVDNASTDGTGALAAARGARVVYEPVANRSRARNCGVAAAASRLYAFTDADCVADPEWLAQLLAHADLAPLVAGDVRVTTSASPNAIERFETLWRFGQESWVKQGWAATANLLVHADAFEAVGGFDVAYLGYGEDADFCLRAGRAGQSLAYCGAAIVEHAGEGSVGALMSRFFKHGYGGTQARYRLGVGYRAWRHPRPLIDPSFALRQLGHDRSRFQPDEWRRMARLAWLGYGARVAGSIWAEILHVR